MNHKEIASIRLFFPPLVLSSGPNSPKSPPPGTKTVWSIWFRKFLGAIALILQVVWAATYSVAAEKPFPNLVVNPGFELDVDGDGSPDGWRGRETSFAPDHGQRKRGMKSSRALYFEAGSTAVWETTVKKIRPGHHYLLTFWVKREGWKDGEYPSFRIFGRSIRMNELFSWRSWRKVTYLLRAERSHETTLAFLGGALSHGISLDKVSLQEFAVQILRPENGTTLRNKNPIFSWRIPESDLLFRISIELFENRVSASLTERETVRIDIMSPQTSSIRFRKGLSTGIWHWRIRAHLGRKEVTRTPLRSFKIPFGALKSNTVYPARIRLYPKSPRLPFFPVGLFAANRIEKFGELKAAGFNSVQKYSLHPEKVKTYFEAAVRHGLRVLILVPRDLGWRRAIYEPALRAAIASGALLGWYLEDEPEGRGVPPAAIWQRGMILRQWDQTHPTTLTILRSRMAKYYGPAADIVLVDPYPVPTQPLTWLSDSIDEVRRALGPAKKIWAIIQAFGWRHDPLYPKDKPGRFPTFEEQRALAYLSITHQANGIFFFSEKQARKNLAHWKGLKILATELNCLQPLLLSSATSWQPKMQSTSLDTKGKPTVHFIVKRLKKNALQPTKAGCLNMKKGRHLIAVNTASRSTSAEFHELPENTIAIDIFNDKKKKTFGGKLREIFEAHGVRIWRLGERE